MVIASWVFSLVVTTVIAVVVSFWGWFAVKIVDQGRKLVELESRILSQEKTNDERLQWMRNMDGKLSKVAEDTAAIRAAVKRGRDHE